MKVPPHADNESQRLAALEAYHLLQTFPEQVLDELTTLAATICDVPISMISLVGEAHQKFLSKVGVDFDQTPRDVSFCGHAIQHRDLMVVPDATQDERFLDNPMVTGELGVRFYAGAPLVTPSGEALGTLCILDRVPRQLMPSQLSALRVLSRQVMSQLELRRQTRELVASQEQLSFALDATLDGLWDWSIPTGEVHFSPQWARLLGYRPEEVPQRVEFFFTVLHPDDVPRVQKVLDDHLQGRTPVKQDEIRLKMKSGEYRWFLDRGKVVTRDASGTPLRMVGTITDISARKQTEAALQASENELRLITNKVPGPVSRVDRNLRYRFVNDQYEVTLGKRRDEVLGALMPEVLGPDLFRQAEPNIRRALGGEHVTFETRYVAPGGDERFSLVNLIPDVGSGGEVVGFFVVALDITDRKRAESALRVSDAALKSISQGVLITSVDGTILSANQAFCAITGYEDSAIQGRSSEFLYEGLNDPASLKALKNALREGREFSGELLDRRKDGSRYWNDMTVTPVRDERGELTHFICVIRDISQRRRLEDQLRQVQKMEAIGQLAGGVAHDFNNILAAILGNVELALMDTPGEHPARESLHEIKNASARAKSLIQQILAFSRQQPQERRVMTLAPVVQEALGFLRATIPAVVTVVATTEPDMPPIMGDPTQIHQIIVNLFTNAWHAMDDQPGRIEISLHSMTLEEGHVSRMAGMRAGRYACLSVKDTGKGMDAATLERIFDPFFTTKDPGKGTGLGLSVVHGIVQAHDGWINVSSQLGRGSTFQVFFPVTATQEELKGETAPNLKRGDGHHILYIDDETSLVALAKRMLERFGYRVSGFSDTGQAMKHFRENPSAFDLVITDLNMPGYSGLQMAAEFLRMRKDLPVVLCSGRVTEDLKQRAFNAGIKDVLHKPNTSEELSETVHRLIGLR